MASTTTTALLDDLLSSDHASTTKACKAATALDLVLDGDADALRCLLQSDATCIDVNARSATTGRALLHEACAEGSLEIVKLLLEKTDADLMLRTLLVRLHCCNQTAPVLPHLRRLTDLLTVPCRAAARRCTLQSQTTIAQSRSCC